MTLSKAIQRLKTLGFNISPSQASDSVWGRQEPETFDFSPSHITSTPFRDVFIGKAKGGWYVTSHIKFKGRIYRHRHEQNFEILNIFGGGKTLEDAMLEFEVNFRSKTFNVSVWGVKA